jgi:N-acetylmuramoyl-L-alanine amidase
MCRYKWIPVFFFLSILAGSQIFSQETKRLFRVVIDAGHGGKDPGALGKKTQEKQVTLQIALKLGDLIHQNCKDVIVYYTRDKDEFIELYQRAGLANRLKADLFISIHCNSNPSRSLHGSETYVMGLHKSEANLAIAKQENSAILLETDYTSSYNGFDPNSDESYIIFTLYQDAYLEQSTNFASIVQDEMKSRKGSADRGVRQAGFLVLYKTTMPSVLVETGFLSNPEEEKFLISNTGQEFYAAAIFKAFLKYKKEFSGTTEPVVPSNKQNDIAGKPDPCKTGDPKKENPKKETPKKNSSSPVTPQPKEQVVFRVQVLTSPKEIDSGSAKLAGLSNIKMYRQQGLYKYTTGEESSLDKALQLQEAIQKKGFKDAFVVAFQGENRIPVSEAKKILNKD